MNNVRFYLAVIVTLCLLTCSLRNEVGVDLKDGTGSCNVTFNFTQIGAFAKKMTTAEIQMGKLFIDLSAQGQFTIYDTIQLSGGNNQQTVVKTYSGLLASVNDMAVEWKMSVAARDANDRTVYIGDTAFTIMPEDTVGVVMFLEPLYSMLVANYYPIRDSVTRCVLAVDGDPMADSLFPKQTLVGDTVTLSYDYLTATPTGTSHHIDLDVYGDLGGNEVLMFTGDTTILARSGEDSTYNVELTYVGPESYTGAVTMVVVLGRVGTTVINGRITETTLTMEAHGCGTVSPPGETRVLYDVPYQISATPCSGYAFCGWRVTGGTAVIADSTAVTTTVTLQNGKVTVLGVFCTFTGAYGGN
jgi:hypothetical protein